MSETTDNSKSSSTSTPGASSGDAWTSARAEAVRRQSQSDQPRRGASGWPWAITGIALAFAAGLLANPWFEAKVRSHLPEPLRSFGTAGGAGVSGASGQQLTDLETRLAALEARPSGSVDLQAVNERIARLEAVQGAEATALQQEQQALAADAGLSQRLTALEGRVNTLDQSVANMNAQAQTLQNAHAQLDSQLTRFTTDTNAQLQALEGQGAQARTLLLLAAVRRALDSGQPMTVPVDQLARIVGPNNPDVVALETVAKGAPTIAQLRQRLAQQKQALLARQTAAEGPWYERVGESLRSLVQVRRAGEPASAVSGDVASQLNTMDQRLARGDVMGALAASQSLPQNARTALRPLLADMEALANARQALSRLETTALAG